MAKTIPIFEVVDIVPAGGGRPQYTRTTNPTSVRAVESSVDQLKSQMSNFIEGVQELLATGAQIAGEFRMQTVEVQAQIGVEGKIGFLGTGAAATGSSQIKIVFQREAA